MKLESETLLNKFFLYTVLENVVENSVPYLKYSYKKYKAVRYTRKHDKFSGKIRFTSRVEKEYLKPAYVASIDKELEDRLFDVKLKCFYQSINKFTNFRGAVPYRPAQDLAFSVAWFIQKGGSFINYYMASINQALLRFLIISISLLYRSATATKMGTLERSSQSNKALMWSANVLGPVDLHDLNEGKIDLTWQKWSYKVGLKGSLLDLHSLSGSASVEWVDDTLMATSQPLTWYKTNFKSPPGDEPLALDMNSTGNGQIRINGQSIGCYCPAYNAAGIMYLARGYTPKGNLLVVFEEWGGNPDGISLVKREIQIVCAGIYDAHVAGNQQWRAVFEYAVRGVWC
ncbi:hypothetical protein QQ045_009859 [Rhodiola kirilowii]